MDDMPPIVALLPIAEAGFPDIMSPVIFTPLCNFKCRYCLNTDVVKDQIKDRWSLEDVLSYLKEKEEEYILISGGEPCIHQGIENLVRALHDEGYKVRISTNGSYPDKIKPMVEEGILSFVAQDIKTSPDKIEMMKELVSNSRQAGGVINKLKESIEFLNHTIEEPDKFPEFTFEFRTTLDPRYVSDEDIESISCYIHPDAVWFLQQFRARKGLLGGDYMADVEPYDDETLDRLFQLAKSRVPRTQIRWP